MDLSAPRGVQFYTGFHGVLSDGGLFVETGMKLEVGQRVEVLIELGEGQAPMIAEGLVAWSRSKTEHENRLGCGVGVHLTSPPDALSTLQALFNPNAAIFYAA
jgi:Tfp pilus assembly protein PilZ